MRSVLTVICVAVGMTWPGEPALAARPPIVAAAADLKFALAEVAARFAEDTGHELRLSYGSSGNFAHQILHGAPYELFLSADEAYVFLLAERGLTRDRPPGCAWVPAHPADGPPHRSGPSLACDAVTP